MLNVAVPNVEGFLERQAELRVKLGGPVTFRVPVAPTWPGGTKINPTTLLPYDSTAKPTNTTHTDVVKTCLIILKQASPLRPQPDTDVAALGLASGMDIILDIAASDFPDIEDASEFTAQTLDYRAVENKPFSIGGTIYRWLVYGEAK